MPPSFFINLAIGSDRWQSSGRRPEGTPGSGVAAGGRSPGGFTLVELLVVIAVIVILVLLVTPAFTQVNAARQLTSAAYDISGALENARAYAKANGTYTWVGFYEEDGSQGSPNATPNGNGGRVIVSTVASKDATTTYVYGSNKYVDASGNSNLIQLGKLLKINGMHLAVLGTNEVPQRGKVTDASGNMVNVPYAYQVGEVNGTNPPAAGGFAPSTSSNQATFGYPLNKSNPTYKFVKIIQFNPLGDAAKIVDSPYQLVEIGLRFARGNVVDTAAKDCAAVQVTGIGGQTRIYQP